MAGIKIMVKRRKALLARVERCTMSLQTAHLVKLIWFDLVVLDYLWWLKASLAICWADKCWFSCGVAAGFVLYKIQLAGYLFEFGVLLRRLLQWRSLSRVQV